MKNLLFYLVTMILLFFLAEYAFRFYTKFETIYDIEMHKYALKLKQVSHTDGLSHEHIPNTEAQLMNVNVAINNIGLRDDFIDNLKNKNEYRIIYLGSSITMGWGVPFDSVFTSLLEEKLNTNNNNIYYNIINAGIGNYNTEMESIYLDMNIASLQPDQVFLHYFINDAEILNQNENHYLVKTSYLVAYFYIRLKHLLINSSSNYNSIGQYYLDLYTEKNTGWENAKKSITRINDICKSNDIGFSVVIQPDLQNLSKDSDEFKCHSIIKNFLRFNNIEFIDLFDDFSLKIKNDPKVYWVAPGDRHPNSKGHKLIFDSLYENLSLLYK